MLNNLYQRWTRMNAGQNPVNASDVSDDLVSTPSVGFRQACGTGTLVSGAATIATGLTSIIDFQAAVNVQPNGTGAVSPQLLVGVATTGSVAVTAYYISSVTGATTISSGSSGTFTWCANGT